MRDVKKNTGKNTREYEKVIADIREKEAEISKMKPSFIKAKEKSAHLNKKKEGAIKSLDQAKKAEDSHKKVFIKTMLVSCKSKLSFRASFRRNDLEQNLTCGFINCVLKL